MCPRWRRRRPKPRPIVLTLNLYLKRVILIESDGFCHIKIRTENLRGFPGGSLVKNLPAVQEMDQTWIWSLDQEDPLEEEMATHSRILAWENPMDRGVWRATDHGVTKPNVTEQVKAHTHRILELNIHSWVSFHSEVWKRYTVRFLTFEFLFPRPFSHYTISPSAGAPESFIKSRDWGTGCLDSCFLLPAWPGAMD